MTRNSDIEIDELVREPKPLSLGWELRILDRSTMIYVKKFFDTKGIKNNTFRVIWRQLHSNPSDFCAILGVIPLGSNTLFRLRRYDSKHIHSNPIEKEKFNDFHIHKATERYQEYGTKEEDKYAETTNRFSSLTGALQCLIKDCYFQMPATSQLSLFPDEGEHLWL